MYDVDYRECVCEAYCDPKEMKFRIFKDLNLLRFSKNIFLHEIYFRHPVRRKQSYIFFWPKVHNFDFHSQLQKLTLLTKPPDFLD